MIVIFCVLFVIFNFPFKRGLFPFIKKNKINHLKDIVMNKKLLVIIVALIAVIVGLGYLYQTVPPQSEVVEVSLQNNKGENIGAVRLSETRAGVLLSLNVSGLKADSAHAIHIHEKGNCSPQATFKNAGGHYNPHEKSHGMKHPEGMHAGDMPNLKPDDKGAIETQILNTKITLMPLGTPNDRASVFDADGSAIVIHAGADDHVSQPSGAAGARIACGVIAKN